MNLVLKGFNLGIIGPKGHIGKNLVLLFKKQTKAKLFFLKREDSVQEFFSKKLDVIINCSGISNPKDIRKYPHAVKKITKLMDRHILNYQKQHPHTLSIFFSSGSIHPRFNRPFLNLKTKRYKNTYAQTKKESEKLHRLHYKQNIVDLRIFGFLSPLQNLGHGFFLSDLAKAYLTRKTLKISEQNIFRDFLHPKDLFNAILLCIFYFKKHKKLNYAFDLYTKRPCSKKQILSLFKVKTSFKGYNELSVNKIHYYSKNKAIGRILRYKPKYSSLDTVKYFKRGLKK